MDITKVQSMLRMADPKNGGRTEERENALRMAEREMDKNGWSFASLGFSIDEAERIANQFSIAAPGKWRDDAKQSIGIFRGQRKSDKPVRRETVSTQTITSPKKPQSSPQETYVEQCERLDHEENTRKYEAWEANRRVQEAEEAKVQQFVGYAFLAFIGFAIVVFGVFAYSMGLDTLDELTTIIGQIIAAAILLGVAYLIYRFIRNVVGLFQ